MAHLRESIQDTRMQIVLNTASVANTIFMRDTDIVNRMIEEIWQKCFERGNPWVQEDYKVLS